MIRTLSYTLEILYQALTVDYVYSLDSFEYANYYNAFTFAITFLSSNIVNNYICTVILSLLGHVSTSMLYSHCFQNIN